MLFSLSIFFFCSMGIYVDDIIHQTPPHDTLTRCPRSLVFFRVTPSPTGLWVRQKQPVEQEGRADQAGSVETMFPNPDSRNNLS